MSGNSNKQTGSTPQTTPRKDSVLTPDSKKSNSNPTTPSSSNLSSSGSFASNSPAPADNGERGGYTTFEVSRTFGKGFVRKSGPSAHEHIQYPFVVCEMDKDGQGGYNFPWLGLHGNKQVKSLPEECPQAKKVYFQLNLGYTLTTQEPQSSAFKDAIQQVTGKIENLEWRKKVYLAIVITDMAHPVAKDTDLSAHLSVADQCIAISARSSAAARPKTSSKSPVRKRPRDNI